MCLATGKEVGTVKAHLLLPGPIHGYSKLRLVSMGGARRLLDSFDLTIWTHPPMAYQLAPLCQKAVQAYGV